MQDTISSLDFGEPGQIDASLSERARGLVGSEILKIAASIRKMVAEGQTVCNLTVGDFDSRYFPIPDVILDGVQRALREGETNYPPSDGILDLRESVLQYVAREWGASYPLESTLIASGARPILYAAYRTILDPGDTVVYPVPSWNNNHYGWITAAETVAVPTHAEDGFMPTLELLAPYLGRARLICLNSPLNPTGTVIGRDALHEITEAIVRENERRSRSGEKHLFLLHDQVYAALVFGDARHHMPVALVPEAAPWTISLDGISKGFAATGLRVGWVLAAPAVIRRMRSLIGHVGAWAPRAEQVAVARFLRDTQAVAAYRAEMDCRVQQRLVALFDGFSAMKRDGYPVDCISPQGAIYLSLKLDLVGRTVAGRRLETNEEIRQLLLDRAAVAVVPFQAFGLDEESGWFRLSVGAVSMDDIADCFPRIRELLDQRH